MLCYYFVVAATISSDHLENFQMRILDPDGREVHHVVAEENPHKFVVTYTPLRDGIHHVSEGLPTCSQIRQPLTGRLRYVGYRICVSISLYHILRGTIW